MVGAGVGGGGVGVGGFGGFLVCLKLATVKLLSLIFRAQFSSSVPIMWFSYFMEGVEKYGMTLLHFPTLQGYAMTVLKLLVGSYSMRKQSKIIGLDAKCRFIILEVIFDCIY